MTTAEWEGGNSSPCLGRGQQFRDHDAVGQAHGAADGGHQFFESINAQSMQERGVHVCNADSFAGFLADAFRISFAVHITAPDSAAGEGDRKAGGPNDPDHRRR